MPAALTIPTAARPALYVRGLVKRYGQLAAVDGLDLEVMPGECFGLLGPNGAGKTTTIEILEGLMPASAGEVEVLGIRWREGRDLVDDFRRQGGTTLLTTHYMDEAERLCDRVAIMDHGKIIALGTPAELIATLGAEHVVEFAVEGELELAAVERLPGVSQARSEAGGMALIVREPHVSVPALLEELARQRVPLARLTTHHATLEDV